jgi:hypothetical protein
MQGCIRRGDRCDRGRTQILRKINFVTKMLEKFRLKYLFILQLVILNEFFDAYKVKVNKDIF